MTGREERATRWRQRWWAWLLMGVVALTTLVLSIDTTPSTGTDDTRLYSIAVQLKCLQCVGESVGASQAPLAVQFREEIVSQMRQGRTDDEILAFFSQRYGQEVLLSPPATGLGSLVWIIPVVGIAAAGLALGATFGRWRREIGARSTEADRDLVADALRERGVDSPGTVGARTTGDSDRAAPASSPADGS